MSDSTWNNKSNFIYPYYHYHGQVKPENLVFNANLQEFSQKVSYLTSLETSGKLSPGEVYQQIQALWELLKLSKEGLNIGVDNDQ